MIDARLQDVMRILHLHHSTTIATLQNALVALGQTLELSVA
jgi:hypothetical protein